VVPCAAASLSANAISIGSAAYAVLARTAQHSHIELGLHAQRPRSGEIKSRYMSLLNLVVTCGYLNTVCCVVNSRFLCTWTLVNLYISCVFLFPPFMLFVYLCTCIVSFSCKGGQH